MSSNLPGDSSLSTVITRDEAIENWLNYEFQFVRHQFERDGVPDYPARSESFSNYADALCKNGEISEWQYMNWTHPAECGD